MPSEYSAEYSPEFDTLAISNIRSVAAWASGSFVVGQRCGNAGNAYECITAGTSTAAPTGTGASINNGGTAVFKFSSSIDYTTPQAWLNAQSGLSTPTDGVIWNDTTWTTASGDIWLSDFGLTLPTPIKFYAAAGEGLNSKPSTALAFNAANGVHFIGPNPSTSSFCIWFNTQKITITGIQFQSASSAPLVIGFTTPNADGSGGSAGSLLDRCIVDGVTGYSSAQMLYFVAQNCDATNCLIVDRGPADGTTFTAKWDVAGSGRCANTTFISTNGKTLQSGAALANLNTAANSGVVTNCGFFGYTTPLLCQNAAGSVSASNCCTDNATIFGPTSFAGNDLGGNLVSKTASNQFVNTSSDWRLKQGADCINAGITDTTDIPAAIDFFGTARPQGTNWDIGPYEYPAGIAQTASAHFTGAGSLTSHAQVRLAASTSLAGLGSVTANAIRIPATTTVIAGTGSLTANAMVRAAVQSAISGAGSVTAQPVLIAHARATIEGTVTLSGDFFNYGVQANAPGAGQLYEIRYRVSGTSAWTDYGTTTSLSEPIVGLEPNTDYDIQITSINAVGRTNSQIVHITTAGRAPTAPTGLSATNIFAGSLVLNWDPSASGTSPISYQVQYRVTGAGNFVNYGSADFVPTETITGLQSSTSYDFLVIAENSAGSVPSAPLTVRTAQAGTLPSTPTNLSVTNITTTSATFSWQPSTGTTPITYQPEFQIVGATSWTPLTPTSGLTTSITGLISNTQYNFGVSASNSIGTSSVATTSVRTAAASGAPSAPTGLAASSVTSSSLTLSWSGSTGSPTPTYQVAYRPSGVGNFSNFGSAQSGLSEVISGLGASTTYDFQVTAINSAGSSPSTIFTVTTAAANVAPSLPTGLGSSNVTATSLTLNWIPSTGTPTIIYQVQYRLTGTSSWTNVTPTVTSPTEGITNLAPSTSYDFQIVASNNFGNATSGTITLTTGGSGVAPSAPTGLVIGTITQTSIALSWTASATGSDTITYTPQYEAAGQHNFISGTSTTTTSATITGLSSGVTYTIQVQASNSAGSSTSSTITATTKPTPSADGSTLTTTTGTIVDSNFNIWQLGGSPMVVQWNPAPNYSGFVNVGTTSGVTVLLFYGGNIYYQNNSAAWFEFGAGQFNSAFSNAYAISAGWASIAADPRHVESAQGTTVTSATGTIFDASLNTWTLSGPSGTLSVYENSQPAGSGSNIILLLYWNHAVYREDNTAAWSSWNGSAWVSAPRDPRITESAQGTTLTTTSGAIYDAALTPWTLVQSSGSGLQIAKGGQVDGNTSNVIVLLYWNHTIYQENSSGGWWLYDATQATPWTQVSGDPRGTGGGGPGAGAVFFDDFGVLSLINSRDSNTAGNFWQPAYWYATDGLLVNSTWALNPFNPATPLNNVYAVANSLLTMTMEVTPGSVTGAVQSAAYVGATMSTEPHFQQEFGYFECSVKVPLVPGTLFAFWLFQDVQSRPEVDVIEIASGQNTDGSLWQVAKFSLWNADNNNPQIQNFLYNYDNPNGVSINPADGFHQYGVLLDASNVTVYWDRKQVGQFPLPSGYTNFKFFPILEWGDGGSWSGPIPSPSTQLPAAVQVDYVGIWNSFPGTGTTIADVTAIALSSTSIVATSPVGTAVGAITVTMSDASMFSGTLSLGGTNASSFAISAGQLVTNATLVAGSNYAISITAIGPNNSLTQNFTITATGSGGGTGTGPASSSSFITADFTSAQNYVSPGTGQQIVSQRMWGVSTGTTGNTNFVTPTYGVDKSAAQAAYAQINPGLWRVNGDIPERSDVQWFNSDGSVFQPTWNSLINNFPKLDPLGISGWIIGCNVGSGVGDASAIANPGWANGDANGYGQAMGNLAAYLNAATMPNGKKFPILGFECHNEPDGHIDWNTLASFFNAMTSRIKAVNSNLVVCGPTTSSAGAAGNFKSLVNELDVFDYHVYIGGNDPGQAAYATTRGTEDGQGAGLSNFGGNTQVTFLGEYNIDWNCAAASQGNYIGPIYDATMLLQVLNQCAGPFWAGIWDSASDGTCGIIQGSPPVLVPSAFLIAQGVRHVYGPRWKVTVNAPGFLTCAVSPTPTSWSVMLVNHGQGVQSGKTVAISHMPGSSSGTVTAQVWQTSQANPNGTTFTVGVTAGVTSALNFPDPSVTIIFV